MRKYTKMDQIRRALPRLKSGAMIQVRYESAKRPDRDSQLHSLPAMKAGFDLRVYTGQLDSVHKTNGINPQLILTMRVLERIDLTTGAYQFRSLNLNRGRVRWLKVL